MPEAATGSQIIIVSIKKQWAFHPRHVMFAIWGSKNNYDSKFILVTDSDVNIRDDFELMRAIFMRVEPIRDVVILTEAGSHAVDPTHGKDVASKMGIDATMPYEYDIALPPDEYFQKVSEKWSEYGISK
jgi:UbiD family decarboxylase